MIIDKKKELRFQILLHIVFILMCLLAVIPMCMLVTISLTNESFITKNGYAVFIRLKGFSTAAYRYIFQTPATIVNAYKTTILIALVGTFLYIIMATLCAYPLSRSHFRLRKQVTWFLLITMLFDGGTAASYIVFSTVYMLKNTYTVLLIFGMGSVWNVFMLRAFMQALPQDMLEAAMIDGAGQVTIYTRFVLPMSKACIAVVAFSTFRGFWDSWIPCLYYIDKPEMYTLQYLLQKMLQQIQLIKKQMEMGLKVYERLPSESLRMAMVILTIGPSIFIFPFFQKYFARGLVLGSAKG